MSHHPIPKLDRQGLRDFGLLFGGIIAGLFGLLLPLLRHHDLPWWPWAIAIGLGTLAFLAPNLLNPIYLIWMRFGLLMSAIQTPIILGVVFYLVLFPLALFKRLKKDDPMRRTLHREQETYRVQSKLRSKVSMERPF